MSAAEESKKETEPMVLKIGLHHIEKKWCEEILKKCGWDSLAEYELSVRERWTCVVEPRGKLMNTEPETLPEGTQLFDIAIHQLVFGPCNALINIMKTDKTKFEMSRDEENHIYITVTKKEHQEKTNDVRDVEESEEIKPSRLSIMKDKIRQKTDKLRTKASLLRTKITKRKSVATDVPEQ